MLTQRDFVFGSAPGLRGSPIIIHPSAWNSISQKFECSITGKELLMKFGSWPSTRAFPQPFTRSSALLHLPASEACRRTPYGGRVDSRRPVGQAVVSPTFR